jgi:hypothetical protein
MSVLCRESWDGTDGSLCVVPDAEDLRAAVAADAGHVVAARRGRHRLHRGRRPGSRHPPASTAVSLCVYQVILVRHLSLPRFVVMVIPLRPPSLRLLVARRHCRCSSIGRGVHRHHVPATAVAAVSYPAVHDGVGASAVLERRGVVEAAELVHSRRREEVVRGDGGASAKVQVVELLQVVCSGDHGVILLLLAPPAQRLRVRVIQAAGLRCDGRPGCSGDMVIVHAVRLRHNAVEVVAEGQRGLGLLEALGGAADGERAALQDALHVVPAHVEVGDGVEPAELDRSDVVRLRSLLLRAYKKNADPSLSFSTMNSPSARGACMHASRRKVLHVTCVGYIISLSIWCDSNQSTATARALDLQLNSFLSN